jgi:hypothetical protein
MFSNGRIVRNEAGSHGACGSSFCVNSSKVSSLQVFSSSNVMPDITVSEIASETGSGKIDFKKKKKLLLPLGA